MHPMWCIVEGEKMKREQLFRKRTLELNILPNREEMGKAAAQDVSLAMKRTIKEKGGVTMVFAAAPSQNEFLAHLSKAKNINWSRVICFHLDEYVELPRFHANTFEVYLREHLFGRVRPKAVYFMKALKGGAEQIARQYARLIQRSGGLDIACIGIGENGHIAFNEPGSDIYDPQMVRLITIDSRSVRQQYRDYKDHPNLAARYSSLAAVPRKAITLTIPAILSAQEIYTIVPGPQKAEAVRKMWEGPISSGCPSAALRLHRFVKIYLDRDSARRLRKEASAD
jgi:glucosamine-6-phosphate deaminase